MRCKRCHGLIVAETPIDSQRNERLFDRGGWRCVNCGELLDAGILRNRAWRRARPFETRAAFAGNTTSFQAELRQASVMNGRLALGLTIKRRTA
jgi:hypothetical protein